MTEVIGVRFKQVGKIYYFSPNGVQMPVGEKVIVETARGIECGEVAISNRQIMTRGLSSRSRRLSAWPTRTTCAASRKIRSRKKRRSSSAWKRLRSISSR